MVSNKVETQYESIKLQFFYSREQLYPNYKFPVPYLIDQSNQKVISRHILLHSSGKVRFLKKCSGSGRGAYYSPLHLFHLDIIFRFAPKPLPLSWRQPVSRILESSDIKKMVFIWDSFTCTTSITTIITSSITPRCTEPVRCVCGGSPKSLFFLVHLTSSLPTCSSRDQFPQPAKCKVKARKGDATK